MAGVTVLIRGRRRKWSTATEADGSFFVSSLMTGNYDAQLDEDLLPAGYSIEALAEPQQVTVGVSTQGHVTFTIRAFRSISGRVLSYDSKVGQYVPVIGAQVILREAGLTTVSDVAARYLFLNLAAGSYTVSVQNEAQASTHTVRLSAQPIGLINVDFQISRPGSQNIPAAAMLPGKT